MDSDKIADAIRWAAFIVGILVIVGLQIHAYSLGVWMK
jgi:hypothetical protein